MKKYWLILLLVFSPSLLFAWGVMGVSGGAPASSGTTSYRFYWSCDTLPTEATESATTLTDASGNYKIWRSHASYALVDVAGHSGTAGAAWGQDRSNWQNARVTRTFIPTDKATIKLYIYKDSARSPGTNSILFRTNGYGEDNSCACQFNSNGYIYFKVTDGSSTSMYCYGNANLTDDTWYLLECKFDVSAGTISMTLDGSDLASSTGASLSTITAWGSDSEASFGIYDDDFGRWDEIYVYNN